MIRSIILILLLALMPQASCSKSEPITPIKKSGETVEKDPASSSSVDECDVSSSGDADDDSDDEDTSLWLIAAASYDDDIKSIIDSNCISCHDGADEFSLKTFNEVSGRKEVIVPKGSASDFQPVNNSHSGRFSLSPNQKQLLIDWADADYPELTVEDSEDTDTDRDDDEDKDSDSDSDSDDDSSDSSSDGCDTTSTTSSGDDDDEITFPKTLLSPAKLKECNDDDLVYDREKNKGVKEDDQECTEFVLGDWCTISGIKDEFGTSGKAVEDAINDLKGDGWEIDQCGEDGSERFVYLYKKEIDQDQAKLKIKKLKPKK